MYPVLSLGSFELSSFAVAVAVACLVGAILGTSQARHVGADPNIVWRFIPWAVIAGLIGGRLYQSVINALNGGSALSPFVSRGGLVYYGAIAAGFVVAWLFVRREGYASHLLFDLGAPCVAFSHAIGRVGCFLVGDDYGKPSTLPWAVAFPDGAPPTTAATLRAAGADIPPDVAADAILRVHPTQLYEAAALTLFGIVLWRASRTPHRPWTVFGWYAILYGIWRFAIEFLRIKNDQVGVLGLTSAQVISAGLAVLGSFLLLRARRSN